MGAVDQRAQTIPETADSDSIQRNWTSAAMLVYIALPKSARQVADGERLFAALSRGVKFE